MYTGRPKLQYLEGFDSRMSITVLKYITTKKGKYTVAKGLKN